MVEHLIPKVGKEEDDDRKVDNEVFYLKMEGDYYRYLAEIGLDKKGNNRS